MKKSAQRDANTARWLYKAEPIELSPALRTLFTRALDSQNLISLRWSLPSPTDPVWWRSMQATSSYRGNRPTIPQTRKHTNKQANKQQTGAKTHYKSKSKSLDFVITRLLVKLFRTNNIETVEFCQDQFGFDKPMQFMHARRVRNFDSKFVASENAFCKLTLSL